jgi:hypothetical protein
MNLYWQQRRLLKLLYEEEVDSPEKSFSILLKHGESEDYFLVEGEKDHTHSGGHIEDFSHRYPTWLIYPLATDGFVRLRCQETGTCWGEESRRRGEEPEEVEEKKGAEGDGNECRTTKSYALWITPKGIELVERSFKEQ